MDDPVDISDDPCLDNETSQIEMGLETLKEGLTLLQEIDTKTSAWPGVIHTRVLIDIWHAMARIKVAKEHGLRRLFS